MSGSTSHSVKVVQPGAGEARVVGRGIAVAFKIDGQDTDGGVSIVEQPFDVGALVPPHIHTHEDEVSIREFRPRTHPPVVRPLNMAVKLGGVRLTTS